MKIKLNSSLFVNCVIAAVLLIIITSQFTHLLFGPATYSGTGRATTNSWSNNVKPIDAAIPDDLPHRQYLKLQDSITTIRNLKNGTSLNLGGTTITFMGLIGVISNVSCDTCRSFRWASSSAAIDMFFHNESFKKYYITLPNWKLLAEDKFRYIDGNKFFVEHGQAFVRRAVAFKTIARPNDDYNQIKIEDTPVKFRYNTATQLMLIPVSKTIYNCVLIGLAALFLLVCFCALLLIGAFFKLIIDLSKGLSFTDANTKRLKVMAMVLLIYSISQLLLIFVLRLIFNSYFIPELTLDKNIFQNLWMHLLAGLIFLLLYRAFKQGRALKEEHDLTV